MGLEGELVPPALDLERFRLTRNLNHRTGACLHRADGIRQGLGIARRVSRADRRLLIGPGHSERNARYKGAAADVPATLAQYETFVFLPTALEPFGRAVVEAWAAGLELVVNRNVGAIYWIENDPGALDSAAADFWTLVTE